MSIKKLPQNICNEMCVNIINQTTEAMSVAGIEGNYIFVNPAFCNLMGYSKDELLERTVFDMKAPNQDKSSFNKSKTSEEGNKIEVWLKKKDGTIFIAEVFIKGLWVIKLFKLNFSPFFISFFV